MTLWQRMRALMGRVRRGQEREDPVQPRGYPRRREDAPPRLLFPPPYPGPDVLGRIWEQRAPINYLNLHLPDGTTVPIIPLLRLPLLTPGTWTNNDPGAGSVSWAGCQLAHEGEMFEIDDGNTALAYIYWDKSVSQTAFQTSAGKPTLDPTEDLLVCFNDGGTAKLAFLSDLIQAGLIVCQQLDVLSANMGILTAGEIQLGTGTPGVDFTGIWIYKSDGTYRVSGWLNNVLQAYMDSDGAFKAGQGKVRLDANGLCIEVPYGTPADWHTIRFKTDTGDNLTTLIDYMSADKNRFQIRAQHTDGTTDVAYLEFDTVEGVTVHLESVLTNKIFDVRGGDLLISTLLKGILFSDSWPPDQDTKIWLDGANLKFKDANAGTKTLSQLAEMRNEVTGGYKYHDLAAGATANITVNYSESLSGPASSVVATVNIGADIDPSDFSWYIRSHTSSQCVVRVKNSRIYDTGLYVQVVAVKT